MPDVELPNPEEIEEQKKSRFTRGVALSVACYAVMLALTSLGGSNAGKDGILSQQEASNQWAFYQAQVIREHQYRIANLRLELELTERGASMSPEVRKQAESLLAHFKNEEQRYHAEKQRIREDAEKNVKKRDIALTRDPYFDYAEALLQIAIVLASVGMLASSRPIYLASIVVALLGAFLSINGYGLFVHVPFLGD